MDLLTETLETEPTSLIQEDGGFSPLLSQITHALIKRQQMVPCVCTAASTSGNTILLFAPVIPSIWQSHRGVEVALWFCAVSSIPRGHHFPKAPNGFLPFCVPVPRHPGGPWLQLCWVFLVRCCLAAFCSYTIFWLLFYNVFWSYPIRYLRIY